MAQDDAVTWDQLKRARTDILRQIETLQTPSRSYNQLLNQDLIARLRDTLAQIDEQLAQWKPQGS